MLAVGRRIRSRTRTSAIARSERAMLAKVLSCAVVGLEGELVEVEVDLASGGLPAFKSVGLQRWRESPLQRQFRSRGLIP